MLLSTQASERGMTAPGEGDARTSAGEKLEGGVLFFRGFLCKCVFRGLFFCGACTLSRFV